MNSIPEHFKEEATHKLNSDRTDLPQNGLQKYTISQ